MNSNPKHRPWITGSTAAQDLIEEALCEKKLGNYFCVEIFPVPPSVGTELQRGRLWHNDFQKKTPSEGIHPTTTRLKLRLDRKESPQTAYWYDEESCEAPHESRLLKPGTRTERGNVKNASGDGTMDNGGTKTRSATGSREEGEDQGGKEVEGARTEAGKAEDHETQF
ncbi:unnamed protein product [Rhizoctonia solani]|nr:unnamed protein product [Rhizoctonia solani]